MAVLGWLPTPVRRTVLILPVALVVGYVMVPQLAGAGRTADALAEVEPALVALAVALQVASIVSQAALTLAVLPAGGRPRFGTMIRIELASTAVSHTVPGGTAAGTALGFRLLTNHGVRGSDAGFAVGTRGIGSAVVLNVLLWLALVVSIPRHGFTPLYTVAAGLGVALLGGFAALVILLMRHEERARRILCRVVAPIPLLDEDRVPDVVARLASRLHDLAGDRGVVARAVGWSAAYWLLSAASLWVFLAAFGHRADPASLTVAFGLANVLAVIPVTPRGLGVVEATLIPLLVGFGGERAATTLAVLAWRFVSFWLPIPAGGAAYLSLRATSGRAEPEDEADREARREAERERRRREMEAAYRRAETLDAWARRRGLRLRD